MAKSENATVTMSFRFTPSLALKVREAAQRMADDNLSEFARMVFEAALYPDLRPDGQSAPASRAAEYVAAKDAAIMFEDDVFATLVKHFGTDHVERDYRFPGAEPYVCDFRITMKGGFSCIVEAKSSPRMERVELALGQAMIAKVRVKLPVVAVLPYFLDDTAKIAKSFDDLGCKLVALPDLIGAIEDLAAKHRRK